VLLNGQRLTRCCEVQPGPNGWAVRLADDEEGRVHACQNCGNDACEEVLYGDVQVILAAQPA